MKNIKKYKKMRIIVLNISILVLLFLVACGKKEENIIKDIKVNTLTINKDNSILEIACEDYNKSGIKTKDIKQYIEDAVNQYNESNGKDCIEFLEYDEENDFVRVALNYNDISHYNKFNNTNYNCADFDGSFNGSNIESTFTSMDGTIYEASAIPIEEGLQIITINDECNLLFEGKMLYYNSNVVIIDNQVSTNGEGAAIIIYKN